MYEKTSDQKFSKYGNVYETNTRKLFSRNFVSKELQSKDKFTATLLEYDSRVFIRILNGVGMIVVSDKEGGELEEFVIHGVVEMNPYVSFQIVPISDEVKYEVISDRDVNYRIIFLEHKYTYSPIATSVYAFEILAYYYNVKSPNYYFIGETHDFYELTFVDYGSLETNVDDKKYILNENDLMIYGPGQFHNQISIGEKSVSYLTIIFKLSIEHKSYILNRVFHCNKEIHDALALFTKESSSQLPYKRDMLIISLNMIIARLLQSEYISKTDLKVNVNKKNTSSQLLDDIIIYINDNIYEPISVEDICTNFSISRSSLQTLFKDNLSDTPKHYINDLKLTKAKQLIKENKYTISEIAFKLGYNSIHYFSRLFTSHNGITPTDYAKKIYKS